MKKLLLILALLGLSVATLKAAQKTQDKINEKNRLPHWTQREQAYLDTVIPRLKALSDSDPRRLMLRYFEFLQEPIQDKADDFTKALLDKREDLKVPLSGIGIFSGDPLLCESQKGDCRYSVGNLSDRHLVPLLKKGDEPALQVALTRFLVASPSQAEFFSYIAAFRTPKILTRHSHEVLTVLHKMRESLAAYNPGPACYHFKFFEHRLTEATIRKDLEIKQAQQLLSSCQKSAAK